MASNTFADWRQGLVTHSAEEMRAAASSLAPLLPPATVLALHGDLGAGKTTFVQGLALGLGLTSSVTSPTFNLFTLHRSSNRTLLHLDAYRLDHAAQMDDLMLEDFMTPPWWLAVEWPEKIPGWLPPSSLHLWFELRPDHTHTVRLTD